MCILLVQFYTTFNIKNQSTFFIIIFNITQSTNIEFAFVFKHTLSTHDLQTFLSN